MLSQNVVCGLLRIQLLFLLAILCLELTGPLLKGKNTLKDIEGKTQEEKVYKEGLEIARVTASKQRTISFGTLQKSWQYPIDGNDLELLYRIVEAEAGGEDETGKCLVANVVLNRVKHEGFPDTVSEVILQRENGKIQFSPVASGRLWQIVVSKDTKEAVEKALDGEDISKGALYFAARKIANRNKMRWFDEELTFLFRHGGHEFFK